MDAAPQTSRLGVIHFLGWMLGCGVVLAVLRAIGEHQAIPEKLELRARLIQLGFGLTYGTAVSGMGLFLWRWWTGQGPGPSQPGHWLLLFGGVGLLIDLGTGGAVQLGLWLAGKSIRPTNFNFVHYLLYQCIGYSVALVIGLIALARLRGASGLWKIAAMCVVLMLTVNAALNCTSLVALHRGAKGTWLWYLPEIANWLFPTCCLPFIWAAELADRIRGLPRDWLHNGGILAISGLGLVAFAMRLPVLWS